MYVAVCALALGFTACGSDDDGGSPDTFECLGITYTRGENGNAIADDGTDTETDFDQFVATAEATGLCNIDISI